MMKGIILAAVAGIGMMVMLFGSAYIVDEGHVGVKTVWGEAISQEPPSGIQFKMPIMTDIKAFDVRERRATETLQAATANQLPISAEVSVNWRLDPTAVLETFRAYGSPEQFESIVLDPRARQAAKAGLSSFQASELIRDRTAAAEEILRLLTEAMEGYPASIISLQIENVSLPERYMESVMRKEEAREDASREQYRLEQQKLEAQREVQTAEAQRDAAVAKAEGRAQAIQLEAEAEAKAIRVKAEAEADGIKAIENALSNNPLFVDFERAKRWNGQLPTTIFSDTMPMIGTMDINR